MHKYKEFKVLGPTPREAMCIRSDNEVYGGGGDPDYKLMVGAIYLVDSARGFKWRTIRQWGRGFQLRPVRRTGIVL